jgi:hypothetical protein
MPRVPPTSATPWAATFRRREEVSRRDRAAVARARLRLSTTTLTPLYEERFSEDELKQVIAWLESPVSRKFAQRRGVRQRAGRKSSWRTPRSRSTKLKRWKPLCPSAWACLPRPRRRPRRAVAPHRRSSRNPRCPTPTPRRRSARPAPASTRRPRTARAAEPARRRWRWRSAKSRSAKARCFPPRARGAGDRRAEGRQPRPAEDRQRRADLARDHVRLPSLETPLRVAYLGPAGTFSEEAALGYFGSSIVRVPCASIDEVFRATSGRRRRLRRGAGGKLHRRRGGALARPVPEHAAVHHRRDQPVRAPQPAAQGDSLDGIEGRVRSSAGAGAVPRLAVDHLPRSSAGPVASNAEGARLAAARPGAGRHRQRPRGGEYGLHVVAPAIQDDPHNRTRFAVVAHPEATRSRAPPDTTAPAWWCRCPTARAPCTTCWCR